MDGDVEPVLSDAADSSRGRASTLPAELSSFVGRGPLVQRGAALLEQARVVSLVGPGGSGKTRLAGRIAAAAAASGFARVSWVELAALGDRPQVDVAVARAVGLQLAAVAAERRVEVFAAALGGTRVLLVLDNCEHLLGPVPDLVDGLLRALPLLTVLTTSREPLGVEGELVWRIPPLEVPPASASAEEVWTYEAAQLFVDRAAHAGTPLPATPEVAAAVAAICRGLDGMPLALELAAARTGVLPVGAILSELDDRLRVFAGGPRPAAPRLRSLAASTAWSHDLCTHEEQVLLRRLAVFADGFDAAAVSRVAGADSPSRASVVETLTGLVRKSLVQFDPGQVGFGRYRLLETIRVFARERLAESGEATATADRHLGWASELAEALEPATMRADPDALDLLDREMPNLRAALAHARAHPSPGYTGLRLIAALGVFWARRGHGFASTDLGEGVVEAAGSVVGADVVDLRVRARWAIGYARFFGGDFPAAAAMVTLAFEDAGSDPAGAAGENDPAGLARCRQLLGALRTFTDPSGARKVFDQVLAVARRSGDPWLEYEALGMIAYSHNLQHRPFAGASVQRRYALLAQARGDPNGRAWSHLDTAMAAHADGRLADARAGYRGALVIADELHDPLLRLHGYTGLTTVALAMGDGGDLREIAVTMNRPELRFAEMARTLAAALPRIARIATDPAAAVPAVVEAGAALTAYVPFDGARLLLLGARYALALADVETTERVASEVLRACDAVDSALAGPCRVLLARVLRHRGEPASALCHDGLTDIVGALLWADLPDALDLLAGTALDADRPAVAVRLLGAGHALRTRSGAVDPLASHTAVDTENARDLIGDGFDDVWAEGSALDAAAVVAYVRRARGPRGRPRSGWGSLTATEVEVVRLVTEGLTNPQAAARLHVSPGTVKTHLSHVFAKLGVTSRAGLAATAIRHDLH